MEVLAFLTVLWGAGWSVLLEFAPKLGEWFAGLTANGRRGMILFLNLAGVILVTLVECGTTYSLGGEVVCDGNLLQSVIDASLLYVIGLGSSFGAHYVSPRKGA